MKDSMKSRDASRLFIAEPDSTESDALVCRACGSDLSLHQPDPEMPERILGTCEECKTWYLFDGDLECVEIAPRRTGQGELPIANPSPVSSHADPSSECICLRLHRLRFRSSLLWDSIEGTWENRGLLSPKGQTPNRYALLEPVRWMADRIDFARMSRVNLNTPLTQRSLDSSEARTRQRQTRCQR